VINGHSFVACQSSLFSLLFQSLGQASRLRRLSLSFHSQLVGEMVPGYRCSSNLSFVAAVGTTLIHLARTSLCLPLRIHADFPPLFTVVSAQTTIFIPKWETDRAFAYMLGIGSGTTTYAVEIGGFSERTPIFRSTSSLPILMTSV
jgi:hypothetical protein